MRNDSFQRRLALFQDAVADATTGTIQAFLINGHARLTVVANSNYALTLKVYQGSLGADGTTYFWPVLTTIAIPGSLTDGAGVGASVEVVGDFAYATVTNASGSAAAPNVAIFGRHTS